MRCPVVALALALGCAGPDEATPQTTDGETGSATTSGSVATTSSSSGTATSTSSASTTSSSSGDASSGDGSAGTGDPFALEIHTLLLPDGRLALECNLPPEVAACEALGAPAPCHDEDLDGLVDAWEDAVIDRLRPLRRLDEQESFPGDAAAVVADVGRVARSPAGGFLLFAMLGWSRDYGSCGTGLSAHDGDSERIVLELEPWAEGGPGGVAIISAYTAAHEGTINDHGRVFTGADLSLLVFGPDPTTGEPRWIVFPSADKHATYASVEICEGISMVPCLDEDCGPDGVRDPAAYDLLPTFVNAGEDGAPIVDDLSVVGFPGDLAWARQDFCGGQGGTNCSASVREKLLVNPF
jgi:hypothetical protein